MLLSSLDGIVWQAAQSAHIPPYPGFRAVVHAPQAGPAGGAAALLRRLLGGVLGWCWGHRAPELPRAAADGVGLSVNSLGAARSLQGGKAEPVAAAEHEEGGGPGAELTS